MEDFLDMIIPVSLVLIAIFGKVFKANKENKNDNGSLNNRGGSGYIKSKKSSTVTYDDNWKKVKECLENKLMEAGNKMESSMKSGLYGNALNTTSSNGGYDRPNSTNRPRTNPMVKDPKDEVSLRNQRISKPNSPNHLKKNQKDHAGVQILGETASTRDAQDSFSRAHHKAYDAWMLDQSDLQKKMADFHRHVEEQHAMQRRMIEETRNQNR